MSTSEGMQTQHKELSQLFNSLPTFAQSKRETESILATFSALSLRHRYLHAKVFELAQARLADSGIHRPATRFAFIILGSGARDEQSIASDQDHALVYEGEQESVHDYFSRLSELIAALLHEVGYPLCSGNVMASNPRWRGSAIHWKARLQDYEALPNWDHIRFLLIAADARIICGDDVLVRAIRAQAVQAVARSAFIKWKIADQGMAQKVTLTLLGNLRLETGGEHKGLFALKEGLYTPLVNAVRLWALSMGLEEPGTERRIAELVTARAWNEALAASVRTALVTTLAVRLQHHLALSAAGLPIDDYVLPESLPTELLSGLKVAHRTVRQLQQLTARHFPKGG